MHDGTIRSLIIKLLLVLVFAVVGLWSWNTLAELAGLPGAHFKHALAACFIVLTVRGLWSYGYERENRQSR